VFVELRRHSRVTQPAQASRDYISTSRKISIALHDERCIDELIAARLNSKTLPFG
jgi:hypothetical protein